MLRRMAGTPTAPPRTSGSGRAVPNIGLDLGVISPTLFAMLVIMALVTTLATTPVLDVLTAGRPASRLQGRDA